MTLIKNKIGRVSQSYGDFDPDREQGYDTTNRCSLYGCEWESKIEHNTFPPATLVDGKVVPDTENWRLVAGNPENYGIGDTVDRLASIQVITPEEIDALVG